MERFDLILMVEDNEIDTYLQSTIIKKSGLCKEVVCCENGEKALSVVEKVNPDLILLDLDMPIMDGFEFLDSLHQANYNDLPVVVLSSSENLLDIERAAQYQVLYYLSKPLTREKLEKMWERCFG